MTPALFLDIAMGPGLRLLPPLMDTPAARVLLLAIALQESGLSDRHQAGGTARSYFQFERAGLVGVLRHQRSKERAQQVCHHFDIDPIVGSVMFAVTYADALAVALARLLLWTVPRVLPEVGASGFAWDYYAECWRPGRPRPETWPGHYGTAVRSVLAHDVGVV